MGVCMRCLARVFAGPKGKHRLCRARFPVTLTVVW